MEFEQLVKLIEVMDASGLTEFDYETDAIKLHLGRKIENVVHMTSIEQGMIPMQQVPMGNTKPAETDPVDTQCDVAETKAAQKNGTDIVSPIVGMFYAASSPEAEPFVKVGDRVSKGQVIGIVEAMKLMNEIQSDVAGIVTEIYVENGDGVEYGQPLICVQE
jgi:acetyl-CoA carboxylase biotin carboxyl carrier protein